MFGIDVTYLGSLHGGPKVYAVCNSGTLVLYCPNDLMSYCPVVGTVEYRFR